MTEKQRYIDAYCQIRSAIKKIAKENGLVCGDMPATSFDEGMAVNVSLYSCAPERKYKEWYRKLSDDLGLDKGKLGEKVRLSDSGPVYTVEGLDPDGGEICIRFLSEDGEVCFVSPEKLKKYNSL